MKVNLCSGIGFYVMQNYNHSHQSIIVSYLWTAITHSLSMCVLSPSLSMYVYIYRSDFSTIFVLVIIRSRLMWENLYDFSGQAHRSFKLERAAFPGNERR